MFESLGCSVYLTECENHKAPLAASAAGGAPVFLSLHISEEFTPDYPRRVKALCDSLRARGCQILADVSKETLSMFGVRDILSLAETLGLWGLRLDYGFSLEEMKTLAAKMPIAVNASTVTEEDAAALASAGDTVFAMHNFYPRPETGLDEDFLRESTARLHQAGLKVLAFIPGDTVLRGPLFMGLPTLERHRGIAPSAAFADLAVNFGVDGIFAGDPGVSDAEQAYIRHFCQTGEMTLPVHFRPGYEGLYGKTFTCRPDSPAWLIRFQESRTYSRQGVPIPEDNCVARKRGAITMDNRSYARYSGEIQLLRRELPQDSKVNVIGQVSQKHMPLIDCIRRGGRFRLVEE